jgi:hypothetical protein
MKFVEFARNWGRRRMKVNQTKQKVKTGKQENSKFIQCAPNVRWNELDGLFATFLYAYSCALALLVESCNIIFSFTS